MPDQLVDKLQSVLRDAASSAARMAAVAWPPIRAGLITVLQIAAALLLLFEEWGWRPLVALLGELSRFRIVARLERFIAGLPPYGALAALAVPTSLLFPLKFVAVYLLANGYAIAAAALFLGAKIASTALIARLFLLTKPALMRIGWFARTYAWLMPWKDAMFAAIRESWTWRYGRMIKNSIRHEARQTWSTLKPRIGSAWTEWRMRGLAIWTQARPRAVHEAHRVRLAAGRTLFRARRRLKSARLRLSERLRRTELG